MGASEYEARAGVHPERESREWRVKCQTLEHPSSIVYFADCPFCGVEVKLYLWSLCGSGKRCPTCRAMFTSFGQAWRARVAQAPAEEGSGR
jgi:hypothetical protein